MGLTRFPHGISSYGVPVLGGSSGALLTGTAFFVHSGTGSNGNDGLSPQNPFSTLTYALAQCTASKGDVVYLMPGHAESNATTITISKIGVSIIGLGSGTLRPTITVTGAVVGLTVSAASVTIDNLIFPAPGIDSVTADIAIGAAACTVRNCQFIGSVGALNKVNFITLAAAADDSVIEGNYFYNTVVEMTGGAIGIAGACSRVVIQDNFIMDSIGYALGAIYDGATALELLLRRNVMMNAKAATVVLEFGNNSTGVCSFNHIVGRHTTLASNVSAGTGMNFFENRVVEEAALNGAIIPAADAD